MGIRQEGWESALFDYIRAARSRPFVWGEFDCCLFVADIIAAMTGVDVAADFRGRYSTATGALRLVKKSGGDLDGLAETVFSGLGIDPLSSPLMAGRGDILRLILPDNMENFGGMGAVCLGREVAFLTEAGIETLPITMAARKFAARGWRV